MDEDDLLELENYELLQNYGNYRRKHLLEFYEQRFDPLELDEREFYSRYRFSKDSVENHLVQLLYPPDGQRRPNRRGLPFSAVQVTCSALHLLGGNSYFRVEGVANRSARSTAFDHLEEIRGKLALLKDDFVHYPSPIMMADNKQKVFEKYHIPNVIGGIDGMFIPLTSIHDIPAGYNKDLFYCRKHFFALNCMIFAGFDHRIYDIVPNAPGSFHDSTVYNLTMLRQYLETRYPVRHVLVDSAYGLNKYLIKPYKSDDVAACPNKALFNLRHSGARVEMTENTFGIFKRRFPILKGMRLGIKRAIETVEACAVLHNISITLGDILPDHILAEDQDDPPEDPQEEQEQEDQTRAEAYQEGLLARDGLMNECVQVPAEPSEQQRIRRLRQRAARGARR